MFFCYIKNDFLAFCFIYMQLSSTLRKHNRDTLGKAHTIFDTFLSLPGCDKLRTPDAEHLNT